MTPGGKFRHDVANHAPLQIVGTINAICAKIAKNSGHRALYLSGAGVANASYGLPDLGMTTLADVLEDARRITSAVDLPLLVDVDTGFGDIPKTVRDMESIGVAAIHIEDQIAQKRCGHRPNKELVSAQEMGDRLKAALDARANSDFVIMARCDALAPEGLSGLMDRCAYYADLGADMIFAEAMTDLSHYQDIKAKVNVPILANMTEFGKTDLYNVKNLAAAGVDMALYPLSAFRAMNRMAANIYQTILQDGDQKEILEQMQTREELYDLLDYYSYEDRLDSK